MNVDFTPDIELLVQQAIESGRLDRPEDAVQEALTLWAEKERQRRSASSAQPALSAAEKAHVFESWVRSHAPTPLLSDEAIHRENLVRDAR
jgi:Arc/MetJ-type ribon-helix-helix transcriptional regulator